LTCVTTTITADWEYQCGATVVTGSLDYSGLCDDPVEEPVDTITPDGCSIVISASIEAEQCDECSEPVGLCENDCIEITTEEYICIEQDCDNPEYTPTFDISLTCDKEIICPGDEFTITAVYDPIDPGYTGPVFAIITATLGAQASVISYSPAFVAGPPDGTVTGLEVFFGNATGFTFSVTYQLSVSFTKASCDSIAASNDDILAVAGSQNDRNRNAVLKIRCCDGT